MRKCFKLSHLFFLLVAPLVFSPTYAQISGKEKTEAEWINEWMPKYTASPQRTQFNSWAAYRDSVIMAEKLAVAGKPQFPRSSYGTYDDAGSQSQGAKITGLRILRNKEYHLSLEFIETFRNRNKGSMAWLPGTVFYLEAGFDLEYQYDTSEQVVSEPVMPNKQHRLQIPEGPHHELVEISTKDLLFVRSLDTTAGAGYCEMTPGIEGPTKKYYDEIGIPYIPAVLNNAGYFVPRVDANNMMRIQSAFYKVVRGAPQGSLFKTKTARKYKKIKK